jgi:hypothetical protein
MKLLFLLTLTLLTLTGCSLSGPAPSQTPSTEPTPASVSTVSSRPSPAKDPNQQLLEDLNSGASFDFETEFDNLSRDLQ